MIRVVTPYGARQILEISRGAEAMALGARAMDAPLPRRMPKVSLPLAGAVPLLTARFRTLIVNARGLSIRIAIDTARLHRHAVAVAADAEQQREESTRVAAATDAFTRLSAGVAANAAAIRDPIDASSAVVNRNSERFGAFLSDFNQLRETIASVTGAVEDLDAVNRGVAGRIATLKVRSEQTSLSAAGMATGIQALRANTEGAQDELAAFRTGGTTIGGNGIPVPPAPDTYLRVLYCSPRMATALPLSGTTVASAWFSPMGAMGLAWKAR
jgi:hypothetical protein